VRIKAFDLGTHCGVACADDKLVARPVFFELLEPWGRPGTVKFVKDWHRWPLVRKEFLSRVTYCDAVYYEMPMGVKRNRAAEQVLTGLELGLQEACGEAGVPCHGVAQPTVKKFATGRGNAKKWEMQVAAAQIWQIQGQELDENVADALCLLALACDRQGLVLPGYDLRSVQALETRP
jgi:crossover junction endodeoxyribonuclease RuvC